MSKLGLFAVLAGVTLSASTSWAAGTVTVDPNGTSGSGTTTITVRFPTGGQNLLDPFDSVKIGNTTYNSSQFSNTTQGNNTYTLTINANTPLGDQDVTVTAKMNDGTTKDSEKTKVNIKERERPR
jgi:hypothetical protein